MDANTELILIRITGLDRPGLTASFTEILSGYDVTIMDIGQAIFIVPFHWVSCSRAIRQIRVIS